MSDAFRHMARQQLDTDLATARTIGGAPADGWIRALRDALGMTSADLAGRIGMSPQAVRQHEQAEAAGTITLATLRKVAAGLGADVAYAIVPHASLEDMVHTRAREIAIDELARTNHSMRLENQDASDERDAELIADRVRELIDSPRLWRQRP